MVSTVRYRSFKELETRPHRAFYLLVSAVIVISLVAIHPQYLPLHARRALPDLRARSSRSCCSPSRRREPRAAAARAASRTRRRRHHHREGAAPVSRRILIFDTTLRDGEQSPGFSMNIAEKITLAKQLARLGVDVIEAGFPVASDGDFEAVRAIAREVRGPVIAGLARAVPGDIDRCWEAVRHAARPRIHTFLATSDIHIAKKFNTHARGDPAPRASRRCATPRRCTPDVEFSAEDAFRSDWDYLCRVVEAVIDAGATTVNIPDTVGYAIPSEFGELIRTIRERVPNIGARRARGALPRRPRPRRRQLAGGRPERRRAGRVHGERDRRARRQREPRGDRDGPQDPARPLRRDDRASTPRRSPARAACSRASPASTCSRTRRSSAATPSRTSRGSTRTACSRTRGPTRS